MAGVAGGMGPRTARSFPVGRPVPAWRVALAAGALGAQVDVAGEPGKPGASASATKPICLQTERCAIGRHLQAMQATRASCPSHVLACVPSCPGRRPESLVCGRRL